MGKAWPFFMALKSAASTYRRPNFGRFRAPRAKGLNFGPGPAICLGNLGANVREGGYPGNGLKGRAPRWTKLQDRPFFCAVLPFSLLAHTGHLFQVCFRLSLTVPSNTIPKGFWMIAAAYVNPGMTLEHQNPVPTSWQGTKVVPENGDQTKPNQENHLFKESGNGWIEPFRSFCQKRNLLPQKPSSSNSQLVFPRIPGRVGRRSISVHGLVLHGVKVQKNFRLGNLHFASSKGGPRRPV